MPLDTTWMDAMPAVVLPGQRAPTPPPAQQSYTDVIDVGGPRHSPGIPAGEPGSELAPSAVGTGGKGGAPTEKPDTSWMDAMPAVVLPHQGPARDPNDHRITGPIANMGAGTSDALAGAIGAPVDLMTGAINLGLKGVYGAGRAVSGVVGGQKPPDETPQITNPVGGSDSIKSLFGTIGADPRNVVPGGDVDRYARAAGSGAASMVIPWAGARALPALAGIPGALQQAMGSGSAAGQAATGVGAGLGGQAGEDLAPEPLKPLANMAGQIAGGAALAVPAAVTKGVGGVVKNQVSSFTAPFTKAGQERLAGQRIGGAASDLGAVHEALDNPAPLLVPGSEPTTFQATGDLGLGNLERAVAKDNSERFIERANDQNTARVKAVGGAQADGDPHAVGEAFRAQLDAMDRAHEAELTAHRAGAQSAMSGVGGTSTPQQAGETVRGAVDAAFAPRVAGAVRDVDTARQGATAATGALGNAPPVGADAQGTVLQRFGSTLQQGLDALNQAAKVKVSRLYGQVDPDGKLAVDLRPFRDAVKEIVKARPKNAKPLEGEAAAVFGAAQMQPAVQKFSEVGALRQRIGDAMAALRSKPEAAQDYRQLTMLRSALDDTLSGAVAEKAAADASAVRAGTMAPESAIHARLGNQEHDVSGTNGRSAQSALVSGSGSLVREGPGTQGQISDRAGEHVPSSEGRGNAGGRGSVSAQPATEVAPLQGSSQRPPTLHDLIISLGGVKDESGEFAAQDLGRIHHRGGGRLLNPNGLSHDYAREAAVTEGFLPANADVNDFRAAMQSREPVYRITEAHEAARARQDALNTRLTDEARYAARDAVATAVDDAGVRLSRAEVEHATDLHMQGVPVEDALRQATDATAEREFQRNAEYNNVGSPGVPPTARQAEIGETGLTPNFDEAALTRRRKADAAHSDRMQTFGAKVPGVGPALRAGDRPGEFRMGASQVPASLFAPGAGGAERIQAARKAADGNPGLIQTIQDYAAFSFRRAAETPDGTIDPGKAASWRKQHAEAMSAFPELSSKFDNALSAKQAMAEAEARHAALLKEYPIKSGATDADVVARYFRPGIRGAEDVQALIEHTGRSQDALDAVQDYAAQSLRRAAERPDGALDPAAHARWAKAHESALSQFPGLAEKFETAAAATQTMEDAAVRQAAARKAYQTSAVSRLMGDADPVKTVGRILNSDNALAQMQDLARKTAGDPTARAGLRRAVVEHILDSLRGNQKAGEDRLLKSDAFQTFVRKTPAALRTIFSADEVQTIQNVAADLQQAQRSVSGTKLPGGSNTAQDLAAGEKHGSHGPSILSSVIAAQVGGEVMGHAMGHATGGVSRLIGKTMGMVVVPIANAMRAAGMDKVDELVTAAMLNPALAKTLLAKVPPSASAGAALGKIIAGQIQALASTAAVTSSQKDRK